MLVMAFITAETCQGCLLQPSIGGVFHFIGWSCRVRLLSVQPFISQPPSPAGGKEEAKTCRGSKSCHSLKSLLAIHFNMQLCFSRAVVMGRIGRGWGWLWWAFPIVGKAVLSTALCLPWSVHILPRTIPQYKTAEQFLHWMMYRYNIGYYLRSHWYHALSID